MTERRWTILLAMALLLGAPTGAWAEDRPSRAERVEHLEQSLDALTEDVEDLAEPVEEFDLFDECMYLIGVSEIGDRSGLLGFAFGSEQSPHRRALSLDLRGFGRPMFEFLAFPAEEPPSIECNEDAGAEDSGD